jgi:hypothetical protein
MWLPLRLVLEFLGRSAAWLAAVTALAILVGLGLAAFVGSRQESTWKPSSVGAFAGAVLAASLVYRFDLPSFGLEVWHRPLPPIWTAGGAVVGALVVLVVRQRRRA